MRKGVGEDLEGQEGRVEESREVADGRLKGGGILLLGLEVEWGREAEGMVGCSGVIYRCIGRDDGWVLFRWEQEVQEVM